MKKPTSWSVTVASSGDVDEPSAEVAFYLHDAGGESVYSDPVRLAL